MRTFADIVQTMIDYINTKFTDIATFSGSVIRDVVIEAPSNEIALLYKENENTKLLRSLDNASDIPTVDLIQIGNNYGLELLPGTKARGTITFRVLNLSTTESDITIPAGTQVQTAHTTDFAAVVFQTLEDVTFYAASAPSYFNSDTGFYEVTTIIECTDIGKAGNVSTGVINILSTTINRIHSVYNSNTTAGGTEIETNEDFAERILEKLKGNNIGTKSGIKTIAESFSSAIVSVEIVGPNDEEMTRNEYGGSVDVVIQGEYLETATQTEVYETGDTEIILETQPVKSILSVTGYVDGDEYTFSAETDYSFIIDDWSLQNGSILAQSKILWIGTTPDDGSDVTIIYTYNKLVVDLQAEYDDDSNHIIASDILVRTAVEIPTDISLQITVYSGVDKTTVSANCVSALSSFASNLLLGESLNMSDIVGIVENISGVNKVVIPLRSPTTDIEVSKYEYIRLKESPTVEIL